MPSGPSAAAVPPPSVVLVIGGSAGSLTPLTDLVRRLPADLPCPVLVTLHMPEHRRSHLAEILSRAGPLFATPAKDGQAVQPGHVYVATPGRHLLLLDAQLHLNGGPRVNRSRPAVDPLFASAAASTGPGTVAVVLSGSLDDGAVGAGMVALAGGAVLVQDPAEAAFSGMPTAALTAAPGAHALPAAELPQAVLAALRSAARRAESPSSPFSTRRMPLGKGEGPMATTGQMSDTDDTGFLAPHETRLTRLSCPECSGVLAEAELPQITYFRCHVGHQYSPKHLAAAQAESSEAKLWTALAAMEEQATVGHFLAHRAEDATERAALRAQAEETTRRADVLRELLHGWVDAPEALEGGPAEQLTN